MKIYLFKDGASIVAYSRDDKTGYIACGDTLLQCEERAIERIREQYTPPLKIVDVPGYEDRT